MQFSIYKQFSTIKIWPSLYILHIYTYCIYIAYIFYSYIFKLHILHIFYICDLHNAYNAYLTYYCIFNSAAFSGLGDNEVTDPDSGAEAVPYNNTVPYNNGYCSYMHVLLYIDTLCKFLHNLNLHSSHIFCMILLDLSRCQIAPYIQFLNIS